MLAAVIILGLLAFLVATDSDPRPTNQPAEGDAPGKAGLRFAAMAVAARGCRRIAAFFRLTFTGHTVSQAGVRPKPAHAATPLPRSSGAPENARFGSTFASRVAEYHPDTLGR